MRKINLSAILLAITLSLSACTSNVPPPPAQPNSNAISSTISSELSSLPSSDVSSEPSSTPSSEPSSSPSSKVSNSPSSKVSNSPSSKVSSSPSSTSVTPSSTISSSASSKPQNTDLPTPQQGVAEIEDSIFAKVNELRASLGLNAYTRSSLLNSSALLRSKEMYETLKLTHTRPNGELYQTAMDEVGYKYADGQENIGESNEFPVDELAQTFFNGWLNSPSHYKAMINPNLTEMGIALFGDVHNFFATQHFALPG